jgi:uncharacterized protein (UPF0335 family)
MKDELLNITRKVDKIDEKLNSIDTHLAVYNEQLKIHIKRTELLESDVEPIKKHVIQVSGSLKLLGLLATVLAIYATIKQII